MKTMKVVRDGKKMTDEQMGRLTRRFDDLKRRINEGTLEYNWVMGEIQRVNEGRRGSSIHFQNDKAKDGWKLLKDVTFDGKPFVPEFVEFLKPGESRVSGEEMRRRAVKLNAHLGQHHAEYLLEHQELIPKELRGKRPVFPGTTWLHGGGYCLVPCLSWDGGEWCLDFGWLGDDWDRLDRLVSSRE